MSFLLPDQIANSEAGAGCDDLWVFGYGSLMWNPGFNFAERHMGLLTGYHRALCVYSHVHRGTAEKPEHKPWLFSCAAMHM